MHEPVKLRPATREDCRQLWEWRNEEETRQASFNTNFILYDAHERWFLEKLDDSQTGIFIILDNLDNKLGYVRFDFRGEEAEINVSIDREARGRGYGSRAIRLASEYLLTTGMVKRIVAYIKVENATSKSAFEHAGFILLGIKRVLGVEAYEMIYPGKE